MTIAMTIEVSPEQAVKIAELLSDSTPITASAPVSATAPAPQQIQYQTFNPTQTAPTIPVTQLAPTQQVAPTQPQQQQAAIQQPIPTAVKKYTMDELSLASRPIVEAGRQAELIAFLQSFTFTDANGAVRNVQSLRDLPESSYNDFANGIRQMGGRI